MSKLALPTFSVIIPVYNRVLGIRKVIDTIRNQLFNQWELILVDDGSTDDSGLVCDEYSQVDERIITIHQKNKGVSAARNAGLEVAVGEYILFCDSDDCFKENIFDTLWNCVNSRNVPDMIVFGYSCFEYELKIKGHPINCVLERDYIRRVVMPEVLNIVPQTEKYVKPYVWNKAYRRKLLMENRIRFDERRRTWEDGEFITQALDFAKNILFLENVLYQKNSLDNNQEHLSDKYYPETLPLYIEACCQNSITFGQEYNFNNAYTMRCWFEVLDNLFLKTVENNQAESKYLVSETLKDPNVITWIENMSPKNRFEKKMQKKVLQKKWSKVHKLYVNRLLVIKIKKILFLSNILMK